jgi:hypothetical protein
MKKLTAIVTLALTAFGQSAIADEGGSHCDQPMSLVGVNVTQDGATMHFYDGDGETYVVTPGMTNAPEEVIEVQDFFDNGRFSKGMVDFLNARITSILDMAELPRTRLREGFNDFSIFTSGQQAEFQVSFENIMGETVSLGGKLDSNDFDDLIDHHGMIAASAIVNIGDALETIMYEYKQVYQTCTITKNNICS